MLRLGESGTETVCDTPFSCNAPPVCPDVQTPPFNVPWFPLPEESDAVVPLLSSSFQYPARPLGAAFTVSVAGLLVTLPAALLTITRNAEPLSSCVVAGVV